MSQDIKITIGGDATGAIDAVRGLENEFEILGNKLPDINKQYLKMKEAMSNINNGKAGSITQAMKEQIEYNKQIDAYTKKLTVMTNAQIAANNSSKGITDTIKGYENALAILDREAKKAFSAGNLKAYAELNKSYVNTAGALNKVKKAFEDVNKVNRMAEWSSKVKELTKNILTFQILLAPIRKAVSLVSETFTNSISAAGEAEQTFSKLNTVFNDMPQAMEKVAELSNSIGTAQSTSANALSTVGDMLQAQGMGVAESMEIASEWVKKFQDIINFKDINMSLDEFAQNFMSGAAGNLRNFRTFGSIVNESAVKGMVGNDASALEKMVARGTIALDQQKNAIGATNREWNTTLSISRRLSESWLKFKETLGDGLNLIINPIKEATTELLDAFDKWVQFKQGKMTDANFTENNGNPYFGALVADLDLVGKIHGFSVTDNIAENQKTLDMIVTKLSKYETLLPDTIYELSKWLANSYPGSNEEPVPYNEPSAEVREMVSSVNEYLKRERGATTVSQEEKTQAKIEAEKFESFLNAIFEKTGVKPSNYSGNSSNEYVNNIQDKGYQYAIDETLSLIKASGIDGYMNSVNFKFNPDDATIDAYNEMLQALFELGRIADKYKLYDSVEEISDYYKYIQAASKEFQESLNPKNETKKEETKKSTFETMSETYSSTLSDLQYEFLTITSSMKEYELWKQRENNLIMENVDLKEEEKEKLKDIVNDIANQKETNRQAEAWQDVKDAGYSSFGEIGAILKGFSDGTRIQSTLTTIINIISQTEVFTQLASILSDSILPTLNAFLEPILPMLKMVSSIVQNTLTPVLVTLFPILKAIASALVLVGGLFDIVTGLISDTVKKMVGYVCKVLYSINIFGWRPFSALGGAASWADIDILGNAEDKWDKMNGYLAEIADMSMEIENNTEQDDDYLKSYKDLYDSGLINGQTYADYVSHKYGKDYATSYLGGSSYSGYSSTPYIARQTNTFTIEGTSLTRQEIIDLIHSAIYNDGNFSNSVAYS